MLDSGKKQDQPMKGSLNRMLSECTDLGGCFLESITGKTEQYNSTGMLKRT